MIIKRQAGMSLIEMLVAGVILAGGIVGALALQTSANRTTHDALQRTHAAALAHDLIARMRANTQGEAPPTVATVLLEYVGGEKFKNKVVQYGYEGSDSSNKPTAVTKPTKMCDDVTGDACQTGDIAALDIYLWRLKLLGNGTAAGTGGGAKETITSVGLVEPRGCLLVNGHYVSVVITWKGRSDLADITEEFSSGIRKECRVEADLRNRQIYVEAFIF